MSDLRDADERVIAPIPRITIQAFCERPEVAASIEAAAEDRRMQKAHMKVQMGGGPAALEAFRNAPTPNVVILESQGDRAALLGCLDTLAEVCDAGTKVLVIGHVNDVVLYRELIRRGVSEYLIAPLTVLDLVGAISELCARRRSGRADDRGRRGQGRRRLIDDCAQPRLGDGAPALAFDRDGGPRRRLRH